MSGPVPTGRPPDAANAATAAARRLATALGLPETILPRRDPRPVGSRCPVLDWAGSGAMWLTGWPDGPPQWPDGDVIGALEGVVALLGALAGSMGSDPGTLDVGAILTGRAAVSGRGRGGSISVGGGSRMVRAADGWVAVTLSRTADLELLPAFGVDGGPGGEVADGPVPVEVWEALTASVRVRRAAEVVSAGRLLGLPVARVGTSPGGGVLPWSIDRLGRAAAPGRRHLRVVDLSAMWAGPLCAHLLGRAGMEVVKVEDVHRRDAARRGDPWLFEELHRGHEQVVVDLASATGRRILHELVDDADVVVEASRPRALGHLGLAPARFVGARPGRTWVSITGYGRSGRGADRVAFGDDAAAAAGLVARSDPRGPAFCADAVADPVTGLCAATGALGSAAAGGGHLVDCPMRSAAGFVNRFGGCDGEHRVERRGRHWFVAHGETFVRVVRPRSPIGRGSSMPPGEVGASATADR